MRQFHDIEKRWSLLFNTSIGVDLRQAIRDEGDFDPCEDGLRSVCWKSFLLNGVLSKATWTKKLKDSRSGYTSLRDHFLKYIDNPNDLHSSVDPLADDSTSPWATLRQDELDREEIWQDVIRCNVDNHFFREPATQRKLLDILFIYSKLNPDTGYRQGMHELLAPLLWVVYQDSLDVRSVPEHKKDNEGADFMLNVLDSRYIEHDAFSLFCAIMQTLKSFYEMGAAKDSSAIVAQSERIHKELLGATDPELSTHLQVIGIVPQIFAIRWLRLLFGREFNFKDVLRMWDSLFAENLNIEVVSMSCVAMLLRLRWQLVEADYTTALTTLTRLQLPTSGDSVRAIVKDAVKLVKDPTAETGADITQLRTGRRQYTNPLGIDSTLRISTPQPRGHTRVRSQHDSPSGSPARFATPQRHLESLFTNVSSNFQKNAEGWSVQNVSKALRGAVGEARKNFEQLQTGHSRTSSVDARAVPASGDSTSESRERILQETMHKIEERNKALAKMLDSAQEVLRKWKATSGQEVRDEDVFNTALAKIQFVSVYLADPDIPIPPASPISERKMPILANPDVVDSEQQLIRHVKPSVSGPLDNTNVTANISKVVDEAADSPRSVSQGKDGSVNAKTSASSDRQSSSSPSRKPARPTLAESSFSFMLGEDRHRSSFVRSTPLPEERRNSEAQKDRERRDSGDGVTKPKSAKEKKANRTTGDGNQSDDDGFTMSTFQ